MSIHLRAHIRQRGSGRRDEHTLPSAHIDVDADSYEFGKQQILSQLPSGSIVCSWIVSEPTGPAEQQSSASSS